MLPQANDRGPFKVLIETMTVLRRHPLRSRKRSSMHTLAAGREVQCRRWLLRPSCTGAVALSNATRLN
jgi:hypothetical protein